MEISRRSRLGINLTLSLSMFRLGKTLTLIIKVLLVGLSPFCSFFVKRFGFGWKVSGEKGQKGPIFFKLDFSSPT